MTLEDFFNYLKVCVNNSIILTDKEEERSINIIDNDIDNINNNNIFTFNLIKQFINKADKHLINNKNNEDEVYKIKIKEKLVNLPLVINNMNDMRGGKKKKII